MKTVKYSVNMYLSYFAVDTYKLRSLSTIGASRTTE